MFFGINFLFKRIFFFFNRNFKFNYNWWEKIFVYKFSIFDFFKFNFKFYIFDDSNQKREMSSKRFFLFDPISYRFRQKNYLFFFKNFSVLKKTSGVSFKLNSFIINKYYF